MESALKRLSIFEALDEADLCRLGALSELKEWPGNQVVYRTGDRPDGLYGVIRGGVILRTERPGEPIDRVVDLGPGEVFGEMEALNGQEREFTVRTLGETTLVRLPTEAVREFVAGHGLGEALLRMVGTRRRTGQLRSRIAPQSRKEPRIWVDRPVALTLEGGGRVEARLVDLSRGGACLADAPEDWKPGRKLAFTLGIEGRPELLRARAEVRWRRERMVGLAFEGAGPGFRRNVEEALKALVPE